VIACPFLHDRLWKHSVSCNALDDFSFGFRNSPALITGCCYSWWLHEKFSKFVLRQYCAALQVGNLKEQWIARSMPRSISFSAVKLLSFSVASFASAPNLLQHALHKLLCMF
jgi:hypothetical protein